MSSSAAVRLSAVMTVRDEETMIGGALALLSFCDEIVVVVDDRTVDRTAEIAGRYTDKVFLVPFEDFASLRNEGISRATGDWIVLTDADERVTPRLGASIRAATESGAEMWAYEIEIVNFCWGRRLRYGGWREIHRRVARREHMTFSGRVHEHYETPAERIGRLDGELWHFTHRSIEELLLKAIRYGSLDSAERFAAGARPVRAGTFLRVMSWEFARRMIRRAGWRDGMPGIIEAVFQPFALFCASVMLWERQQGDAIARRYAELEREVAEQR